MCHWRVVAQGLMMPMEFQLSTGMLLTKNEIKISSILIWYSSGALQHSIINKWAGPIGSPYEQNINDGNSLF
ncbi:MAG: hypothetical protein EBR75_04475 [Actinobacteria bacterium]|nr:hypothetical protein [Actinomycetota bacterium]